MVDIVNIFIVEDDDNLRTVIKSQLEKYGYIVSDTDDFKNTISIINDCKPDIILMDVNLPYYDGFYLCRALRKKSKTPIIIISSRDTVMEQVHGIEQGADDYITKPFEMELLLAKIKALLRRNYGEYAEKEDKFKNQNDIQLNNNNHTLTYDGRTVELTKNEFKLMDKLFSNRNNIVKREELLAELWDEGMFVDENTLTVNVTRIKNKLKDIGLNEIIRTKRGVGYILDLGLSEERNDE